MIPVRENSEVVIIYPEGTGQRMWNCKGEERLSMIFLWGEQATECEIARGRKMLSILFETIKGLLTNQWMVLWGKSERETHGSLPPKYAELSCSFYHWENNNHPTKKWFQGWSDCWMMLFFREKKCFWVNNHEIVGWDLMRWTRCNLQWCFRKCHAKISEAQCYVRKAGLWRLRNQRTAWWLNSRTTNMDIIRIGILKWSKIETKTDILCVCRCVL